MTNVIIKDSKIQGRGVYALRGIKKGETIIKWHPKKIITKEQMQKLSEDEQNHTHYTGDGKYFVMGEPERFVNHSCNPNSFIGDNEEDIAMRDIKKGEEITSDYAISGVDNWKLKCNCGSKNCRKIIYGNFFKLPKKLQKKYKPYLEDWFKKEFKVKILK